MDAQMFMLDNTSDYNMTSGWLAFPDDPQSPLAYAATSAALSLGHYDLDACDDVWLNRSSSSTTLDSTTAALHDATLDSSNLTSPTPSNTTTTSTTTTTTGTSTTTGTTTAADQDAAIAIPHEAKTINPRDLTAGSVLTPNDSAIDLSAFERSYGTARPAKRKHVGPIDTEPSKRMATPMHTATNSPSYTRPSSPLLFSREVSPTLSFGPPALSSAPKPARSPVVWLTADKTKSRAETQVTWTLALDPLDAKMEYIHFEPKSLPKGKLLASKQERDEFEAKGSALYMSTWVVCADTIKTPEGMREALQRARGEAPSCKRPDGVTVAELDKSDPAHPTNGGEIRICAGCQERERKRYLRKKKQTDDEDEFWSYETDRIVAINEKEFKDLKPAESGLGLGPRAKSVKFHMRIACYGRHQEAPSGFCIIVIFRDSKGNIVAEHCTENLHVTDDHKNRELGASSGNAEQTTPDQAMAPQLPTPPTELAQHYSASSARHYSAASAQLQQGLSVQPHYAQPALVQAQTFTPQQHGLPWQQYASQPGHVFASQMSPPQVYSPPHHLSYQTHVQPFQAELLAARLQSMQQQSVQQQLPQISTSYANQMFANQQMYGQAQPGYSVPPSTPMSYFPGQSPWSNQ